MTPHTEELPAEEQGFAIVTIGERHPNGLAPTRVYRVPIERTNERVTVHDPSQDPLKDHFNLHFETNVRPDGVLVLTSNNARSAAGPHIWCVALDISRRFGDDTYSLVAFNDGRLPKDTIVDEMHFPTLGVDNSTQVAAVVWSTTNGLISQLYVNKEQRRNKLGKKISSLAGAYHYSRGWDGLMHSDGRRTALGEAYVGHMRRQYLIAPHSELNPPMDPE